MTNKTADNVRDCVDYRDFIRERYEAVRKNVPSLSFQILAKRMQTSKSYLKLVIARQRHITLEKIPSLSRVLKLTADETKYLIYLYLRDMSKEASLRHYFSDVLERLQSVAKYVRHNDVSETEGKTEVLFTSWLHMALESMVNIKGFVPDPVWMHARLSGHHLELPQVAQAWQDLQDWGIIKITKAGVETGPFVFRMADPYDDDRLQIYKVGISKAFDVIHHKHDVKPRAHAMMTLSLSQENMEKALAHFYGFRDQLIALSREPQVKQGVLFVSNNIFNLMNNGTEKASHAEAAKPGP